MKRFSFSLKGGYFIVLFTFLFHLLTFAHTTRGHNVIEAGAYKSLLSKGKGEIPGFPNYSGKEILDYLIAHRVLRVPPCYPFSGQADPSCNQYLDYDSIPWLPIIGSGDMDAIFFRQFSTNGQLFHFMATPGDVYRNPEIDERIGAPIGLAVDAYPRVMRFVTSMFYQMLADPDEARNQYRDIYALIHTIGDSYTDAHVERDTTTWEIKYLKPWQATAWQSYLIYWSGWKHFFTDNHHGFPEDSRDKQYLREEFVKPEEIEFYDRNPYVVPRQYLTVRGLMAVEAIEDMLITVFSIYIHKESGNSIISEFSSNEWKSFLQRHFRSTIDTITINSLKLEPPARSEQEWRPLTIIGARNRFGSASGTRDAVFAINFGKPPSPLDPFAFAGGAEVGGRYFTNKTNLIGSASLSLYLWAYSDVLSWGFDPVVIEWMSEGKKITLDPLVSLVRFDTYISRRFWLSAEGLRYSLKDGLRSREFSLSLGIVFSKEILSKKTLSKLFGSKERYPMTDTLAGDEWKIPELDSPLRLRSRLYGFFYPIAYSFYSEGGAHVGMQPIGYSFIWDLQRSSKTSRPAVGFSLGAGFEFFDDDTWGFIKLSPLGRYKFTTLLTLTVEPLSISTRLKFAEKTPVVVDTHALFGFGIIFGTIEIGFDALRYSYRYKRLYQQWIAGMKIGILRE